MENRQVEEPAAPAAGRKRKIIIAGVLLVFIIGGLVYWLLHRGTVSTDDAQVAGDLVPISARVSGYVDAIEVNDNEQVNAGDPLVKLDTRDLNAKYRKALADLNAREAEKNAAGEQVSVTQRTAPASERRAAAGVSVAEESVVTARKQVDVAQAQLASANAGASAAESGVARAKGALGVAQAQVASAQAALKEAQARAESAEADAELAASDLTRYKVMYESGAVSRQQFESVETTNKKAQAALRAEREAVDNARAAVDQAKARRSSAEAEVKQATANLSAAKAAASQARSGVEQAKTAVDQAQARLAEAQATHTAAQTAPEQIAMSQAQENVTSAKIKQSEADVRNAQLQLSYTSIESPVKGVVSQKSVEKGQYVQPGQMLMAVVPLKNVWVVANFKETQIENMRPGQRAVVTVDTYPNVELEGVVNSIGAATSAKFSLLPPQNATGNFVKVVQRIPVKITFTKPLPKGVVLRPGQNVVATVYTR